MEMTVLGWRHPGSGQYDAAPMLQLAIEPPLPDEGPGMRPWVYMRFTLRLVNHRTDRKERVIGGSVALKRRRLLLWRKTLQEVPLLIDEVAITDIELPPMSSAIEVDCHASGNVNDSEAWPSRIEAWIVLDMVGPIRRFERRIETFTRSRR